MKYPPPHKGENFTAAQRQHFVAVLTKGLEKLDTIGHLNRSHFVCIACDDKELVQLIEKRIGGGSVIDWCARQGLHLERTQTQVYRREWMLSMVAEFSAQDVPARLKELEKNKAAMIMAFDKEIEKFKQELVKLKAGLWERPVPGSEVQYYGINAGCNGFKTSRWAAVSENVENYLNAFTDVNVANAHAEAFNVILELRNQPGVEAPVQDKDQWVFTGTMTPSLMRYAHQKVGGVSPCFGSLEALNAAVEAVLPERIAKAIKTLSGKYSN